MTLHYTVRDTGLGIPVDKREKIFRAFEQVDTSTTREFGGTGLGLAITSRLVEAMGGELKVDSVPGEGSEFHFTVRLGRGSQPHERDLPELQNLHVLVVDDNATNRHILKDMLEGWGMKVDAVEGGRQAIAALEQILRAQRVAAARYQRRQHAANGRVYADRGVAIPRRVLRDLAIILLTSGGRAGDSGAVTNCRSPSSDEAGQRFGTAGGHHPNRSDKVRRPSRSANATSQSRRWPLFLPCGFCWRKTARRIRSSPSDC